MPDNTNVNANSAVVVVGRTAPVPPGQQKAEKSIPVVIANDQSTIPVAEQNKVQSEVALSLLGIPRSEVALGIFADVNTYDVNPTEWTSTPDAYSIVVDQEAAATGVGGTYGWGLTHIPEESGALLEAPIDKTAVLTSKRFFRYQPGRVSAATFGVKTSGFSTSVTGANVHNPTVRKYGIFDNYDGYYWETRGSGAGDNFSVVRRTQSLIYDNPLDYGTNTGEQTQDYGRINPLDPTGIRGSENESNATAKKNTAARPKKFGDLVVLRDNLMMTHAGVYDPSLLQEETLNKISETDASADSITVVGLGRTITNATYNISSGLMDITTSEDHGYNVGKYLTLAGIGMTCEYSYCNITEAGYNPTNSNMAASSLPSTIRSGGALATGRIRIKVSDPITGAGTFDKLSNGDLVMIQANSITFSCTHGSGGNKTYPRQQGDGNAGGGPDPAYNNTLVIENKNSTDKTIDLLVLPPGGAASTNTTAHTFVSATDGALILIKDYPNRNTGFNVVKVNNSKSFTVNAGVSTVPTNYFTTAGMRGICIGLTNDQYVRYSKTTNASAINGLEDKGIYRVREVVYDERFSTGICTIKLLDVNKDNQSLTGSDYTASAIDAPHQLITPVPFVQPVDSTKINSGLTKYTSLRTNKEAAESAGTGMFPYMYTVGTSQEGYIDTSNTITAADLKTQIDNVNEFYDNWINQNVAMDYWNVYEYRVPRSRFSGDRLDGKTDLLKYSDVVDTRRAGDAVLDTSTGEAAEDISIWDLEFDKVTMYKIEFSWYGAVGALFLAYVPVSNGEARWVRVHHLRASNQLKVSSLGNATLPITYMAYGGGGPSKSYGYDTVNRLVQFTDALGNESYSENIVKYGASYYIDGGDRGTVKLFSHATPTNVDVYGSKRSYTTGSPSGSNSAISLTNAGSATVDPYIEIGATAGVGSSFYIGSKIITADPLDQNIKIDSIERGTTHKLYLNKSINTIGGSQTIYIIADRKTPVIGLKCRDFIQSSTGRTVRNRTQVYPTRLSTGSNGPKVIQLDFVKTPIFQTDSIVTTTSEGDASSVTIEANPFSKDGNYNLGKRGKPVKVKLPLVTYVGSHTYTGGAVTGNVTTDDGSALKNVTSANTSYNSATGRLKIGITGHGLTAGSKKIRLKKESFAFTCSLDDNATTHNYPRSTDPMMDSNDTSFVDRTWQTSGTAGYMDIGSAAYDPSNGRLTITANGHGLNDGDRVMIKANSLAFTCGAGDGVKTYPRSTGDKIYGSDNQGKADPGFNNWLTVYGKTTNTFNVQVLPNNAQGADGGGSTNTTTHTFNSAGSSLSNALSKAVPTTDEATSDGVWSKKLDIVDSSNADWIEVRVNSNETDTASAAEYIRDIGKGVYGWFRGYYENESPIRHFAVLGYLENKGQDRTKDVEQDSYYFHALESTTDNIIIPAIIDSNANRFIYESNSRPKDGNTISSSVGEFSLAPLSSVKISPQLRSPIPGTGTVVASLFIPATGEEYDLASYFDYNKEYLSFPLTDTIESIFLMASSKETYQSGTVDTSIAASLTWEEQ